MDMDCHHVVGVEMKLDKYSTFWTFKVYWTATNDLLEELLSENIARATGYVCLLIKKTLCNL